MNSKRQHQPALTASARTSSAASAPPKNSPAYSNGGGTDRYTHAFNADEAAAVAKLSTLDAPQAAKATGTHDATAVGFSSAGAGHASVQVSTARPAGYWLHFYALGCSRTPLPAAA